MLKEGQKHKFEYFVGIIKCKKKKERKMWRGWIPVNSSVIVNWQGGERVYENLMRGREESGKWSN